MNDLRALTFQPPFLVSVNIVEYLEPISKLKKLHSDESRLGKLRALRADFPGKQQFVHDSGPSWNTQPRSATDFEIGSNHANSVLVLLAAEPPGSLFLSLCILGDGVLFDNIPNGCSCW
jgi:hypothetical protein